MKANLLLEAPNDIRSGYVNIDPLAPHEDPDRATLDPFNLDHTFDAGELSELVAHGLLDYVPNAQLDVVLNGWLSKLAHGGELTLSVIDLREVCRGVLADRLSLDEANTLLFGEQRVQWQFRKCSLTLARLVEVLRAKGFKILSQRLHNYRAYVTCQRP